MGSKEKYTMGGRELNTTRIVQHEWVSDQKRVQAKGMEMTKLSARTRGSIVAGVGVGAGGVGVIKQRLLLVT